MMVQNLFKASSLILTITQGVYARFPAIAVKLKGVTEAMNPSIALYLIRLRVVEGSSEMGWYFINSLAKKQLKRKKSISSQTESISAYEGIGIKDDDKNNLLHT